LLLVVLACLIGLLRARKLRENAFNIACVVQVMATVAMIAIGRIHFGENYSQQSRYVTLVVPLWVAALCMAVSLMEHYRADRATATTAWPTGMVGVALCLSTLAAGTGWFDGPEVGKDKRADAVKQLRRLVKGKGANKAYAAHWRALGVPLDPKALKAQDAP
jgi:hypothetical protein